MYFELQMNFVLAQTSNRVEVLLQPVTESCGEISYSLILFHMARKKCATIAPADVDGALNAQTIPLVEILTVIALLACCWHFTRKKRDYLSNESFKLLRVHFNRFVFGIESHVVDIC